MPEVEENPILALDMGALLEDLKTFGITDNEEIITLDVRGKVVRLQIANVSNDDEIFGMQRAEGLKGHAWVQRMRCEILARAIVKINNVDIRKVDYAKDPYSGEDRPVRLILVDMFGHWGQEAVLILWKVYMNHCQKLENELLDQLPDAVIMTEVERRFLDRVSEELAVRSAAVIQETTALAASGISEEEAPVG